MKARWPIADVVDADCAELRDLAKWFESHGKPLQSKFLRDVAGRHEIVFGAYSTQVGAEVVRLLREASGPMSHGHWSSDFREQVNKALKKARVK